MEREIHLPSYLNNICALTVVVDDASRDQLRDSRYRGEHRRRRRPERRGPDAHLLRDLRRPGHALEGDHARDLIAGVAAPMDQLLQAGRHGLLEARHQLPVVAAGAGVFQVQPVRDGDEINSARSSLLHVGQCGDEARVVELGVDEGDIEADY
ncbi:hypothetical protein BHE74_00003880 [Ensete ventricosum]|nr:hypothetical protein GW17_00008567 [Ensete ventricosum]RWW87298.1 hypothetical protein BHE74_00003880 [Ensete ventricosum]RZR80260.1 hypothetical protein BHM03_00006242 [Ensete ventricosum]